MLARSTARALLFIAAVPTLSDQPAHPQERAFLNSDEVRQTVVGRGIISRNLQSGMVSHWEFFEDGRVEFANRSGPGSATGTWSLRPDGAMCVSMLAHTGCRYWFRSAAGIANADSPKPDAPTVAEVKFE
ncbi:hypothetical protein QTI66_16940 [Variovorax sp. J22R133]|uniref:hypothetical protein n=1 Tax=Variovorax brevis TaxID=3053503 RepID=UPI002575A818|nr:hypothetical protein [Variovorax sp. J22R133]MDM0113848.1 hypothetical protein [Variovorax sp. J22R133]